ncbi:hypothetical protein RF11_12250 [Thelohanellus kitauei]|uniref:Uncharacterized protein n=1 Tax=Thelohanellus kitauei TaxID=669202 RepID=A0A0C2N9H5_THEKT|nr:hypothetical protein RF11_12250 [Thelohanellus kitauei]
MIIHRWLKSSQTYWLSNRFNFSPAKIRWNFASLKIINKINTSHLTTRHNIINQPTKYLNRDTHLVFHNFELTLILKSRNSESEMVLFTTKTKPFLTRHKFESNLLLTKQMYLNQQYLTTTFPRGPQQASLSALVTYPDNPTHHRKMRT